MTFQKGHPGKKKGTKNSPYPGQTQGRLSPTKKRYAKARAAGASRPAAAVAAGLVSVRAKKGVTGLEWEKDPRMLAAIEYYTEQAPMKPVELNNRLASKIRSVRPNEMGGDHLRAAEILSRNLGLQKQAVEHSGPEGGPIPFADVSDEKLLPLAAAAVEVLRDGNQE